MTIECPKCQTMNPDESKFCMECATPLPGIKEAVSTKTLETPTEELKRGSFFAGRYEIIEELGKGGMGKVYRVEDKKIKKEIALKLIKPEIASDRKTIERFKNELTTARDIRHKNVCGMYDLGEEKELHFITMEYISGQDLKGLIRQTGQLTVGKAVSIAKQICDGLEEAHSLGIVHRDLKPNNIMIDDNGNSRIMDFGIARTIKEKGITGSGVMIGTPEYMSPEQVEAKEVDQRSDIYSLGIIMYEMLTGRLPFEADTPFAIGVKHKSETPKSPKEYNSQISDDLNRAILKCLEKDKENRYKDAGEVKSELEKIDQGLPTTAKIKPQSEPKTVKIGEIKLKNLILYGGISILSLAVLLVVIFTLAGRRKAIDSIAVLPFENRSQDPDLEFWCEGITESIINKLSHLPNLKKVIARTSVFHYKGKEIIPQKVGTELGVDVVLISQIEKRGEELTIRTEIVDTADGSHIWGEPYTFAPSEILAVQDQIANSIAVKMNLKPKSVEEKNLTKRYTEDVDAYNLYNMGRYFWWGRTEKSLYKALDYFTQAVELDPDYALAYTGIADTYSMLNGYQLLAPHNTFPKAKEAVDRALSIDENLAEAHTALAWVKLAYDWDWQGAETEFMKAIELNQNYALAHGWYVWLLMYSSKFDRALEEANLAYRLDPRNMLSPRLVGNVHFYARRYEKAVEYFQQTIEMAPDYPTGYEWLARAYFELDQYEAALEAYQKMWDLSDLPVPFDQSPQRAGILAIMGKGGEAEEIFGNIYKELLNLAEETYIPSVFTAVTCFQLDKVDLGFEWLEKAYAQREYVLLSIKVDPWFDSVRSDPRFQSLLKKMGLD
jgi:serine/threonine protein kinase